MATYSTDGGVYGGRTEKERGWGLHFFLSMSGLRCVCRSYFTHCAADVGMRFNISRGRCKAARCVECLKFTASGSVGAGGLSQRQLKREGKRGDRDRVVFTVSSWWVCEWKWWVCSLRSTSCSTQSEISTVFLKRAPIGPRWKLLRRVNTDVYQYIKWLVLWTAG